LPINVFDKLRAMHKYLQSMVVPENCEQFKRFMAMYAAAEEITNISDKFKVTELLSLELERLKLHFEFVLR